MEKIFNYPNNLLKIEIREQLKQLSLFEEKRLDNTINRAIETVINEGSFLELTKEYENKIVDVTIRNKVISHLTGLEVRMLTSVLILCQLAQSRNKALHNTQNNTVTFTLERANLNKLMGLERGASSRHRKEVYNALLELDKKRFVIPSSNGDVRFPRLVSIDKANLSDKTLTVTVDESFISISEKKSSYFELPSDINSQLRKISTGRPNVGIELFIKCLFQAKHISENNKVEYSYSRLIEIMRLENYKLEGRKQKILGTLDRAFLTAKKLHLISSVKEGKTKFGEVKYIIHFK